MTLRLHLVRDGIRWVSPQPAGKLRLRASLPGAFAFDRAAKALAKARRAGLSNSELLPLACASSWFVNNAAPSTIFRRWIAPPGSDVWLELSLALEGEGAWSGFTEEDRAAILTATSAIAVEGHGIGAISKVLALLVPESVPLMPDAALWFALGAVPRPAKPDAQTAPTSHLCAMLDWFTREVADSRRPLDAVAEALDGAVEALHAAQVLDRIVWFDSIGYRHFRGWFWVKDGASQGVVPVSASFEQPAIAEEPIDLASETVPAAFREEARRALGS